MTWTAADAAVVWREAVTDADVVVLSRREPERFAELFDRHYAEIHGFVSRRVGPQLADDVASETFLIAFRRRKRYDATYVDARPWLYGIASNLVSRHRRSEARRYRALARADAVAEPEARLDVAARVDAQALRRPLAAALVELPAADREVLLLVAWGQLSCEEAARALGIPAGTARSRLHRARRRTRSALDDATATSTREEDRR